MVALSLGIGIASPRRTAGAPAFTGPLDLIAAPTAAAFSTRRLLTAYTGPLLRVRRSIDDAEADIGYGADGWLDEAALLAFVQHGGPGPGNEDGFVTTWYDQSGNGRDATQTTAGNQPPIVVAGVVQTIVGKTRPVLNFVSASPTFMATVATDFDQPYSVALAFAQGAATVSTSVILSRGTLTNGSVFITTAGSLYSRLGNVSSAPTIPINSFLPIVATSYISPARRELRVNDNPDAIKTNVITTEVQDTTLFIGALSAAGLSPFNGKAGEMIYWNDADITANGDQDTVHAEMMATWG